MKETKKTTVRLLSWTTNPLETIYAEWVQSRTTGEVPDPHRLHDERLGLYTKRDKTDEERKHLNHEVLEVFEKVIAMKMPLGETIDFVFLLEHVPVALREQLVRHRIGHKFGDKLGADIIPDLAGNSSFWSQTTRIIDMSTFATDGEYLSPQWLEENGHLPIRDKKLIECPTCGSSSLTIYANNTACVCENGHYNKTEHFKDDEKTSVADFYHDQMKWIQTAYRRLLKAGMPMEDARNILPVAMQHRMTWKCNLSSIMHVLSRRSCWLTQLGMWEPVIEGIIEELATRIHPTFRRLIDPPCCDTSSNFVKCAFSKENEEVIDNGNYPPCSLWVNKEAAYIPRYSSLENDMEQNLVSEAQMPRYRKMQIRYAKLWRRDPKTGVRVELA